MIKTNPDYIKKFLRNVNTVIFNRGYKLHRHITLKYIAIQSIDISEFYIFTKAYRFKFISVFE